MSLVRTVCAATVPSQGPRRRVARESRPPRSSSTGSAGRGDVGDADVDGVPRRWPAARSPPAPWRRCARRRPRRRPGRRPARSRIRVGASATTGQAVAQRRGQRGQHPQRRPGRRVVGPGAATASSTTPAGRSGTRVEHHPVGVEHGEAVGIGTTATGGRSVTSMTRVRGHDAAAPSTAATEGSVATRARDRVGVHPGQRRAVGHRRPPPVPGRRGRAPMPSPRPAARRAPTCRDQPATRRRAAASPTASQHHSSATGTAATAATAPAPRWCSRRDRRPARPSRRARTSFQPAVPRGPRVGRGAGRPRAGRAGRASAASSSSPISEIGGAPMVTTTSPARARRHDLAGHVLPRRDEHLALGRQRDRGGQRDAALAGLAGLAGAEDLHHDRLVGDGQRGGDLGCAGRGCGRPGTAGTPRAAGRRRPPRAASAARRSSRSGGRRTRRRPARRRRRP